MSISRQDLFNCVRLGSHLPQSSKAINYVNNHHMVQPGANKSGELATSCLHGTVGTADFQDKPVLHNMLC